MCFVCHKPNHLCAIVQRRSTFPDLIADKTPSPSVQIYCNREYSFRGTSLNKGENPSVVPQAQACRVEYIGETGRPLHVRIKEHLDGKEKLRASTALRYHKINSHGGEDFGVEVQWGFMLERFATDVIFIARQVMEKYREKRKPCYLAFLDLKKAFDRPALAVIWNALRGRGVRNI
ncbi:unnamed protein product [Heligmosomoides polygyrus]|uniref:Reverse transcriptase domain-containing protein n=1 Tax=Heligmosomoides polygyrus TaxID=6339 RepID=A0A3P8D575_HELPZ|nr:unnamed protein product [Heligmosomoides polygyrus]